jgi:hypothetical protein
MRKNDGPIAAKKRAKRKEILPWRGLRGGARASRPCRPIQPVAKAELAMNVRAGLFHAIATAGKIPHSARFNKHT